MQGMFSVAPLYLQVSAVLEAADLTDCTMTSRTNNRLVVLVGGAIWLTALDVLFLIDFIVLFCL